MKRATPVRLLVPGLLATALVGCAPAAPVTAPLADVRLRARSPIAERSPEGWGTTTIALEDHLGWPYRLQEVVLAVDGVVVYRQRDREGLALDASTILGVIELAPGDHTVQLKVLAAYAATPFSSPDDCQVELHAAQGVRVGWSPAAIELDVHLGGGTKDFHERVAIDIRVRGAEPIEHQVLPHRAHDPVQPDSPEAIVEGLEARLEGARTARDVVAVVCYQDKLAQVRDMMRMRNERALRLQQAASDAELQHQRIVIEVIDARLAQLWAETNQCVSSPLYVVETVGRPVVTGNMTSCTSAGPLMDDEDAQLLGMQR